MKGTRLLVVLCALLVAVSVAQLVVVYRYINARDDVISEAEKTVMRAELDQDKDQ